VASTADLIKGAVERVQREAPSLGNLKLVFGVELRGRGDVQAYRVELPGPVVSKGFSQDERVHVSIPRGDFNDLADKGGLADWRDAYDLGHVKAEGDPEVRKLIGTVIERQIARSRLKRAR
jgi:hypothetical protein